MGGRQKQRTKALCCFLFMAVLKISSIESFSSIARHSATHRLRQQQKEGSALLLSQQPFLYVSAPTTTTPLQPRQQQQCHHPIMSSTTSPLFRRHASSFPLASSRRPNSDDLGDDESDNNSDVPLKFSRADTLVAETSLGLKRASWLSWWCQMILTVTSGVILVFAKNVVGGSRLPGQSPQVNFLLAGTGML